MHTDDSGLEMHARPLQPTLPISGNYHALVSHAVRADRQVQSAYIRDETDATARQVSVLTSHTMGVAALGAGELEYMMLRHLNTSDDQGPWPLNDVGPLEVRQAGCECEGGCESGICCSFLVSLL